MASQVGQLVGTLFHSRDIAHKVHLNCKLYSRHVALNEFYDEIIDLADSFSEKYIAKYKKEIDIQLDWPEDNGEIIDILRADLQRVENLRVSMAQGYSPLQNIIDEICGVYLEAIYKLERLL